MARFHLFASLVLAGASSAAHADILADSRADFSGLQGQGGWYYGYVTPNDNFVGFTQMTQFDGDRWYTNAELYWTMLGPLGGHSNGIITSGGRRTEEQWATRRWVSDYEGLVTVDAVLAKINVGPASNGVTGIVRVDGIEVWRQIVAGTDASGVTAELQFGIQVGSTVDFIMDPVAGNDWSDNALMTAVIQSVPTPGAAGPLALAGLLLTRRRR